MKIRCSKCGREMFLTEFLTYPAAFLVKIFKDVVVQFIVEALKEKLSNPKRGIIDDSMSGLANNFSMACPKCGQIGLWEPAGEAPKKEAAVKESSKKAEQSKESII